MDLEVAFVVCGCVGVYLFSALSSRFKASHRLVCRSFRPLMNLIRILEVSVFKLFMHLSIIFIPALISETVIESSRKLYLLLRQPRHAGKSSCRIRHISIFEQNLLRVVSLIYFYPLLTVISRIGLVSVLFFAILIDHRFLIELIYIIYFMLSCFGHLLI